MARVQIAAGMAPHRAAALRLARVQFGAFLSEEAPRCNLGQLRFLLGELFKNTIDHNDHGATLEMDVRGDVLTFVYVETRPEGNLDALAARMTSDSDESRLAGNGINQGIGFTLLRSAADGLGLSLVAALPGRTVPLTQARWAAGEERAARIASARGMLVYIGHGAI